MITAVGRVKTETVAVADAGKAVADEIGATSAQVALAWVLANPAVASPLVGARTLRQLEDNIGALNVVLSEADKARLDEVRRVEPGFPHDFLSRSEERRVGKECVSTCRSRWSTYH